MYYAVNVSTGKEDYLVHLIKERCNKDIFNEVFIPKRVRSRKVDQVWVDKYENIFPGYIFVDTDNPKDFAITLIRMPDYARMLGREESSGSFVPLSEDECIMLDTLCGKDVNRLVEKSLVTLKEGKEIQIISGPLVGLKGYITKVDLHKKEAIVSVNILGRRTDIKLGINVLREIND